MLNIRLGIIAADNSFPLKKGVVHPSLVAAAAMHEAQTATQRQRLKPRIHMPMEPLQRQSVSSHAASPVASHSSAAHQQQSAGDVAAAAGFAAAAAALQVLQSATKEVQAELQVPSLHRQPRNNIRHTSCILLAIMPLAWCATIPCPPLPPLSNACSGIVRQCLRCADGLHAFVAFASCKHAAFMLCAQILPVSAGQLKAHASVSHLLQAWSSNQICACLYMSCHGQTCLYTPGLKQPHNRTAAYHNAPAIVLS